MRRENPSIDVDGVRRLGPLDEQVVVAWIERVLPDRYVFELELCREGRIGAWTIRKADVDTCALYSSTCSPRPDSILTTKVYVDEQPPECLVRGILATIATQPAHS